MNLSVSKLANLYRLLIDLFIKKLKQNGYSLRNRDSSSAQNFNRDANKGILGWRKEKKVSRNCAHFAIWAAWQTEVMESRACHVRLLARMTFTIFVQKSFGSGGGKNYYFFFFFFKTSLTPPSNFPLTCKLIPLSSYCHLHSLSPSCQLFIIFAPLSLLLPPFGVLQSLEIVLRLSPSTITFMCCRLKKCQKFWV